LGTIIEARRAQSNFQLVIITHDAEFLKAMEVQKFTDTFWHVDRNNRLKSYIEEKPLSKLSDLRG
jgi:DNA repair protein RAD50